MDMSAIGALASSLKVATDITRALVDLRDSKLVQEKVIELNSVILSAQQQALTALSNQFKLQEQVRELESKLARLKSTTEWQQNYVLKQVFIGAWAYVLKLDAQTAEPPHWLCARCFDRGNKSLLQDEGRDKDRSFSIYRCSDCKGSIRVFYNVHPGKIEAA